jgi:hypothetical protein
MHAGQQAPAMAHAPVRQRSMSAYVAIWLALATGGLAYLGIVALRPDLVGAGKSDSAAAGAQVAELTGQLATTKGWLRDLQSELGETRRQLSAEREKTNRLNEQLASAEQERTDLVQALEKHASATAAANAVENTAAAPEANPNPPATMRLSTAAPVAPKKAPPKTAPVVTGAIDTDTSASEKASANEKGSAPAASIAFGAPKVVAAPANPTGIEIADSESLDGLRQSWASISAANTDVMRRLSARYRISAAGKDKPFTLLAGPFPSPAEARKACVSLKARGVACRVGDFVGNAM